MVQPKVILRFVLCAMPETGLAFQRKYFLKKVLRMQFVNNRIYGNEKLLGDCQVVLSEGGVETVSLIPSSHCLT